MFLQYRPVLANDRLKTVFGYTPTRTSREAFDEWRRVSPVILTPCEQSGRAPCRSGW